MRSYTPKALGTRVITWLMVVIMAFGSFQAAAPTQAASTSPSSSSQSAASNALGGKGLTDLGDKPVPVEQDPFGASLKDAKGTIPVMIELTDDPIVVAQYATTGAGKATNAQVQIAVAQKSKIEAAQATTLNALKNSNVKYTYLYQVKNAYNGIAILADAGDLKTLAALPGIKQLHRITTMERNNAYSNNFIGAPIAWGSYGITGNNVKIGIIDTGIDYIHTNFGGRGLQSDYDYAHTITGPVVIKDGVQLYPTPKVAGGYDFAGDDYTAAGAPQPDQNPLDCAADLGGGHGSHVAGTAAGYGVNADGSTYRGPYNENVDLEALRIGPGVAPGATLYALRVFGCTGSTNLTEQAIDWAVDPDGNPATNDHLDVINMSLGASYGSPDDSSASASNNAALAGVTVVISAGNDGDNFYINGSPGSAQRALTVANSGDAEAVTDGFRVTDPDAVTTTTVSGVYPASRSAAYAWQTQTNVSVTVPVTAPLYYPATNQSGCASFDITETNKIAGKIVLLDWATAPGQTTFPCGSAARGANAEAAGAKGMILVSGVPYLDTSITGATHIPSMYTTSTVGDKLKTKLTAGVVSDILVTLTTEYFNKEKVIFVGQNDTIDSSTSRGPQGFGNQLKPDIAAPGTTIFSTASGTGDEGETLSGTSMAAPHMTGVMALLHQKFPGWTPEEYKAAAMNTANHDLYAMLGTIDSPPTTGPKYTGSRVGAGRVDVAQAVADNNRILAYNAENAGAVSVSFGNVEVVNTLAMTKTIKIENKSYTDVTYNLSLNTYSAIPGVTYTFPQGNTVFAPANSTVTFQVQLNANADGMSHPLDPASSLIQLGGFVRNYLSEASANVILTPQAGGFNNLRVPVYAAVRQASDMHANGGLNFSSGNTASVTLGGIGVDQGGPSPTSTYSLVAPLELVKLSPKLALGSSPPYTTSRSSAADLQYIGISSNVAQVGNNIASSSARIYFGLTTWTNWTIAHYYEVEYDIYVDTNKDGNYDYVMYNAPVKNGATFSDLTALTIVNLHTGAAASTTANLLNGLDGQLDFNSFNSNMVVFPVKPSQLGLNSANASFNYEIVTFDRFGLSSVDDEGPFFYDAANPGLSFANFPANPAGYGATLPFYDDQPGVVLTATINTANYARNGTQGMLLLHYHNVTGKHAEVVPVVTNNDCLLTDTSSVRQSTDDGSGTVCGTLSYALKVNSPNGGTQIDFIGLGTGRKIDITPSGPVTLTVPVNTVLLGTSGTGGNSNVSQGCDQANNYILNNTTGYPVVLLLQGGDTVDGLTLNGVKLKASKPSVPATGPNVLKCTVVKAATPI
jgi:subtilisin family serine protease